jgi:hypothetical protein
MMQGTHKYTSKGSVDTSNNPITCPHDPGNIVLDDGHVSEKQSFEGCPGDISEVDYLRNFGANVPAESPGYSPEDGVVET